MITGMQATEKIKLATAMMQPNNYDACKRREARISNSTRK